MCGWGQDAKEFPAVWAPPGHTALAGWMGQVILTSARRADALMPLHFVVEITVGLGDVADWEATPLRNGNALALRLEATTPPTRFAAETVALGAFHETRGRLFGHWFGLDLLFSCHHVMQVRCAQELARIIVSDIVKGLASASGLLHARALARKGSPPYFQKRGAGPDADHGAKKA
jgi:hypothetical protein